MLTNYPLKTTYTSLETTLDALHQMRGVKCVNADDCYAGGDDGIFATTNGGATWTKQSAVGFYRIDCTSSSTCFAADGNTILATTNGRQTWSNAVTIPGAGLIAISCPSASVCFAAGSTIVSTSDGGKTWSTEVNFLGWFAYAITCTSTANSIAAGQGGLDF
jgi:photosystem II stability/assembly factor-like uncharacterized protein